MPASTEQNTMLESLRRLREEFLSSRESLGFTEPVVDPKFWKPDLEPVVDPKVWKPDLEGTVRYAVHPQRRCIRSVQSCVG